ncbi:hypothetical protein L6V77_27355, partial [Myxococcota bacterium]|nr:hypothetical protein [Myxococcota bacterium]
MFRRGFSICTAVVLTACAGPFGDGFFDEPPAIPDGPLGGEPGGAGGSGGEGGIGGEGGAAPPTAWPAVAEALPLEGDVCLWNGDCPADAYCRRPAGRCFGLGVCQRPALGACRHNRCRCEGARVEATAERAGRDRPSAT